MKTNPTIESSPDTAQITGISRAQAHGHIDRLNRILGHYGLMAYLLDERDEAALRRICDKLEAVPLGS